MDDVRVLLVDDEQDFVKSLSERLEMRDFKTETAFDGKQALDAVERFKPGVMVLDLRMPGMDGLEVLERVHRSLPAIQVIILSGHGTDKDREKAMKLGAFAYLQKPVEMKILVESLEQAQKKHKSLQHASDTD